jgi:hypothetical protein
MVGELVRPNPVVPIGRTPGGYATPVTGPLGLYSEHALEVYLNLARRMQLTGIVRLWVTEDARPII